MISLSKSGNTIIFEFENNGHYLQNGTIEVPVNSLTLVTDNSEMFTFKKSATNDIFVSGLYSEIGMTKAELETFYKNNMVGGGGEGDITSGEVQTMIDESISGKADTSAVTEAISAATADYFDGAEYDSGTTRINFLHGNTVKAYIDASAFIVDGMIDDVRIETISGVSYLVIDFNTASGKEDIQIPLTDIFDPDNYYNKTQIDGIVSGLNDSIDTKLDASAFTAYSGAVDSRLAEDEEVTAAAFNDLNERISGISGNNVVELTQAQYDALVSGGTVDTTAFYIITDAPSIDMNNYWTSAQTSSAIDAATSGKVDTSAFTAYSASTDSRLAEDEEVTAAALNVLNTNKLDASAYTPTDLSEYWTSAQTDSAITSAVSGKVDTSAITSAVTSASTDSEIPTAKAVYDAIPQGGGGKAVSGGTNISITTGETADTINCTIPYNDTSNTITYGYYVTNKSQHSFVIGAWCNTTSSTQNNIVVGNDCHSLASNNAAFGQGNYSYNECELSSGHYNVSNKATTIFGDSGNTLFSVGNGTSAAARHNAFEIRQNGDIYCSDGTNDVKLQDYLTFKMVAISQSDYDALVSGGTVDSSTLYIITNVVN